MYFLLSKLPSFTVLIKLESFDEDWTTHISNLLFKSDLSSLKYELYEFHPTVPTY